MFDARKQPMQMHGATYDPSLIDEATDTAQGVGWQAGGPLARVHTLSSEFEAHFLVEALDAEGIDVAVECHLEQALGSLFRPQLGWGALLTRVRDAERALEVIERTLAEVETSASSNLLD